MILLHIFKLYVSLVHVKMYRFY